MDQLPEGDVTVIRAAVMAVAEGPFVPAWEFGTVMGFTAEQVAEIGTLWDEAPDAQELQRVVSSSLVTLTGYPHQLQGTKEWTSRLPVTQVELCEVLARFNACDAVIGPRRDRWSVVLLEGSLLSDDELAASASRWRTAARMGAELGLAVPERLKNL